MSQTKNNPALEGRLKDMDPDQLRERLAELYRLLAT